MYKPFLLDKFRKQEDTMTTADVLNKYKKIAVVGFSHNHDRPSNSIAKYLKQQGYTVYGVNPGLGGRTIDGIEVVSTVAELPEQVNIINVFRRPEALPELVDEVLALDYKPEVIWTQFGVVHPKAKQKALENGFEYIEDRCIYVEHRRM
jgi:predicted CoA-binding protein